MTEGQLVAHGVTKTFGATAALRDGSFTAMKGEVHALMGENGAGKSTLLGVVAGLIQPDGGTLRLGGKPFAPRTAKDARAAGIAIVPQEPTLCAHLTVAENITLGSEPSRHGFVDARARDERCLRAMAPLGVEIDGRRLGADLSPAERQMVSIGRALAQASASVLILDEPTSSLATTEADSVLEAVGRLAASGMCVIYVSHQLDEILRVAHSFTVLRNGETVDRGSISGVTVEDLTRSLLGEALSRARPSARAPGKKLLSLVGVAGKRLPVDASFDLCAGEILGIAGLVGSGRTELVRAIFGLDPVRRGEVRVATGGGGELRTTRGGSPAARLAQKLGMVSEDRKGEGLALSMSVADNLTLSRLGPFERFGLLSGPDQAAAAQRMIERLGIRTPGPSTAVSALSGGNQQKVALGRLLHHDVDVLLLDEPTRGIDIKSRESLYALVSELASAGKAVLWISSQWGELLRVCDRIAVMRRGVLGEARAASTLDERALLAEAAGA